jgi:hypothetical protein
MKSRKAKSRVGHARKEAAAPAKFQPLDNAPQPQAARVFDPKTIVEKLNLWRLNDATAKYFGPMQSGEDWREMSEKDLRRSLRAEGLRRKAAEQELLSEIESVIEYIQHHRLVDFAGPLAGYKPGVHYAPDGKPFIVRGGPKLIHPKQGDWSLIREILEPRFTDSAGPQLEYFLLWLKRALEPLYEGRRRKGPLLILAGPNNCGKSFVQHRIITPVLGGREFDPTDFFKNESGFNKHMMASEHLPIDEFAFPLDTASRLMLSEKFKKIVANDSQIYHPKGRDAMTMHPHFRLSISINDNAEKLRALPPMNNDLADKVVLLKLRGGLSMPMPTNSDEEEARFVEAVRAQLPAFVYHLLNWEPPREISLGRFGMQTWQHPEIVDLLWEQEPVSRFAFLIDRELFPPDDSESWEAWGWSKAVELHERLTRDGSPRCAQFRSLLKYEGSCAQMLGMLHKREANELASGRGVQIAEIRDDDSGRRYAKRHTKTGNFWQIRPPKEKNT